MLDKFLMIVENFYVVFKIDVMVLGYVRDQYICLIVNGIEVLKFLVNIFVQ